VEQAAVDQDQERLQLQPELQEQLIQGVVVVEQDQMLLQLVEPVVQE
tara:strand:- start:35 stop:175 length:141 start_codon:yes stop_codon:yes gene_type:complete